MLTPIDIQNHSLKTGMRGYNKKETDDFLEEILAGYEELYKENREMKEKLTSLSEGIQYYKNMETTLQKALVLAEKTSNETQEAAKSKAEAMLNEANTKAESILNDAKSKAESLRKETKAEVDSLRKETKAYVEITKASANQELETTRNHVRKLVQSYESYRLQFKKLAESQIEMLESDNYSIYAPEITDLMSEEAENLIDDTKEADEQIPLTENSIFADEETEEKVSNISVDEEKTDIEQERINSDAYDTKNVQMENISQDTIEESNITEEEEKVTFSENDYPKMTWNTDFSEEGADENEVNDTSKEDVDANKEPSDYINYTVDLSNTFEEIKKESSSENITSDGKSFEEHAVGDATSWSDTTPKVDGFEQMESINSVVPNTDKEEDSPFTFIDPE